LANPDAAFPRSTFNSRDPEEWREAMGVLYKPGLDRNSANQFHASVDSFMLGDVTLNRCSSVGQSFSRTSGQIGRDGIQSYMVQVFSRGRCHAQAPRGELILDKDDICVFDNAQPLDTFNEDFDLLALVVPRDRLAPLLRDPDGAHYGCVKADLPLAHLFRAHLRELSKIMPSMRQNEAQAVLSTLIPFLAAVLNGGLDLTSDQKELVRQSLRRKIGHYIEANLDSSALQVEDLAAQFGMSRSRFYRLFQNFGGVAEYIQNKRLAVAYERLTGPAARADTINAIAASVGFQSESAFIRAFRRHYGMTPGDARKGFNRGPSDGWRRGRGIHERSWSDWLKIV
jgi:AraC-like DNA-binding protein